MACRERTPQPLASGRNQCWSMDFVSDKLADGTSFRILTVVDQFTRECVWLEADRCMTGANVVAAVTKASAECTGTRMSITCDNGSEFARRIVEAWAMARVDQCVPCGGTLSNVRLIKACTSAIRKRSRHLHTVWPVIRSCGAALRFSIPSAQLSTMRARSGIRSEF